MLPIILGACRMFFRSESSHHVCSRAGCRLTVNSRTILLGLYLAPRRNYRKTAVVAVSFFSFCLTAAQSPPKRSGSDCLVATNIRHGTRCGTPDSFEADRLSALDRTL